MSSAPTWQPNWQEQNDASYALLDKACKKALKSNQFDSKAYHACMVTQCKACAVHTPWESQLDAAEALHLSLDTELIAGTGFGKTLTFLLSLMVEPSTGKKWKTAIVISPLNALEEDQVSLNLELNTLRFELSPDRPESSVHLKSHSGGHQRRDLDRGYCSGMSYCVWPQIITDYSPGHLRHPL